MKVIGLISPYCKNVTVRGYLNRLLHTLKSKGDRFNGTGMVEYLEVVLRRFLRTSLIHSASIFNSNDIRPALPYLEDTEKVCRHLEMKKALIKTLGHLGCVYKRLGRTDKSYQLFQEEEELSRELGDQTGLAYALLDQARILCDKKHVKQGQAEYAEAEAAARNGGGNECLYLALFNTAYFSWYLDQNPRYAIIKCREVMEFVTTLRVYRNELSNTEKLLKEIECSHSV